MAGKKWWNLFVEFEGEGAARPPPEPSADDDAPMSAEDIDAILARTTRAPGAPAATSAPAPKTPEPARPPPRAAAPAPAPVVAPAAAVLEGRPLAEVYAEQGCVPPTAKAVEDVIRFLDGLAGMPVAVQKQALDALDNADETWTIDDVVVDARNKILALERAGAGLDARVVEARSRADLEIADQDALAAATTEKIDAEIAGLHAQIAELEGLKAQELAAAEIAREGSRRTVFEAEAQCAREAARYAEESRRLTRFVDTFTAG